MAAAPTGNRFLDAIAGLDAPLPPEGGGGGAAGLSARLDEIIGSGGQGGGSGGFDWKNALGDIGKVVSTGLHGVYATEQQLGRAASEVAAPIINATGGHVQTVHGVSPRDWWQAVVNPKDQISGGDIMVGSDKTGGVGLFGDNGLVAKTHGTNMNPALQVFGGLGLDVASDPLTWITGGAEGMSKEALAQEAAKETARQALETSAKSAGEYIGGDLPAGMGGVQTTADKIDAVLNRGEAGTHADMLGKLHEAAAGNPEVQDIINRGSDVTARVRRFGVNSLSPDEIQTFLTKGGTVDPLAERGLFLRGFDSKIPLTDRGPLGAIGDLRSAATAKLGDLFTSSPLGHIFGDETSQALRDAARSGNPADAYKAVLGKAVNDTAENSARYLAKGWGARFDTATKNFTEEDMNKLVPALEGDKQAAADLASRHEGVQQLLADVHQRATESGLNIHQIADYSPRELSPEGRQLLEKLGFMRGGNLSPTSSFELGRTLEKGASFGGETLTGDTNAEIRAQVNEIAQRRLAEVDPNAAKNFQGFFNDDAKSSIKNYFGRAAKRVSQADATNRLYAMGLGNSMTQSVADPVAAAAASANRVAADAAEAEANRQIERATLHEAAQTELGQHLMGQRLGQTELSIAGHPVTSPISDEEAIKLAAAGHADAVTNVQAARANLATVGQRVAENAGKRGVAIDSLAHEAAGLDTQLAAAEAGLAAGRDGAEEQVARLQARISNLANEQHTWEVRRDSILQEALDGKRTDVVMPNGWGQRVIDASGQVEATPQGPWREVTPEVAHREAGALGEARQDWETRGPQMRQAAADFHAAYRAGDRAGAADALDRFMGLASPNPPWIVDEKTGATNLVEVDAHAQKLAARTDAHYTPDGAIDASKVRDTMSRVLKAVKQEGERLDREQASAMPLAERAARDPNNGLIPGPLYHGGRAGPLPDVGAMTTPTDAEHATENLDGPGFHTTTDKTGRHISGSQQSQLSEDMRYKGYATDARRGSERQTIDPNAATYTPRDPNARLLPLDTQILPDDLHPTTLAAIDHFYGGDHWMFPSEPLQTGNATLDALAQDDPIGAFFIHDMVQHAIARDAAGNDEGQLIAELVDAYHGHDGFSEPGFGGAYRAYRQHLIDMQSELEHEHSSMAGSLKVTTRTMNSDPAAASIRDYTDHLHDDVGVVGIKREGGAHMHDVVDPVEHEHHIWFQPNKDLELVGRTDYSAAFAEKQVREIVADKARLTDAIGVQRSQAAAAEQDVTQLSEQAKAANDKLAGARRVEAANVGKGKVALDRAQQRVAGALDQSDATEQYMNDTVEQIQARRAAHMEEARQIRTYLESGAPLGDAQRKSLESYVADLHQSVLYGRVHERALSLADEQIKRIASLEEAAHVASARAADLHGVAMDLRSTADQLDKVKIQQISDAWKSGLQQEIRPGLGTPQDIADWITGAQRVTHNPSAFWQRWDKIVGWIKDWQIATPGFQTRNAMGGAFLNAQGGVETKSYLGFTKLWSKALRGTLSDDEQSLFNQIRMATGRGQVEAESRMGLEPGFNDAKGTLNPFSRNNYWIKGNQAAGRNVDFFNRGVMAYDSLIGGDSIDAAIARVNKFHFDFTDLSNTEQQLRHFVPFYTFTSKNLPLQVEQIFQNPKIYSRLFAAKTEIEKASSPDATTPSYFADLMGIRLPFTSGGGHLYADPDLPPAQLGQFINSPSGMLNEAAGLVTPLIKTPIEYKFQHQFFENIPITDAKAVPVPLPATLVKGLAPALDALGLTKEVNGTPYMTQRNAYVLEQAIPILARYSRLMPADAKGRSTQLAQVLTFLGFRVESDSQLVQDSYNKGIAYQKKTSKSTDKAFVKAALKLQAGS